MFEGRRKVWRRRSDGFLIVPNWLALTFKNCCLI
jgi:hypothetical protein